MKIEEAFKSIQLLYIETAPIIYFTENHADYVEKMRAIFKYVIAGLFPVHTSTLTLAECLVKPTQASDKTLIHEYKTLLGNTEGITMSVIDPQVAEEMARVRATHRLRTPDALHIAAALVHHCDAFLTNDTSLRRVSEITVLVLDDLDL